MEFQHLPVVARIGALAALEHAEGSEGRAVRPADRKAEIRGQAVPLEAGIAGPGRRLRMRIRHAQHPACRQDALAIHARAGERRALAHRVRVALVPVGDEDLDLRTDHPHDQPDRYAEPLRHRVDDVLPGRHGLIGHVGTARPRRAGVCVGMRDKLQDALLSPGSAIGHGGRSHGDNLRLYPPSCKIGRLRDFDHLTAPAPHPICSKDRAAGGTDRRADARFRSRSP